MTTTSSRARLHSNYNDQPYPASSPPLVATSFQIRGSRYLSASPPPFRTFRHVFPYTVPQAPVELTSACILYCSTSQRRRVFENNMTLRAAEPWAIILSVLLPIAKVVVAVFFSYLLFQLFLTFLLLYTEYYHMPCSNTIVKTLRTWSNIE